MIFTAKIDNKANFGHFDQKSDVLGTKIANPNENVDNIDIQVSKTTIFRRIFLRRIIDKMYRYNSPEIILNLRYVTEYLTEKQFRYFDLGFLVKLYTSKNQYEKSAKFFLSPRSNKMYHTV